MPPADPHFACSSGLRSTHPDRTAESPRVTAAESPDVENRQVLSLDIHCVAGFVALVRRCVSRSSTSTAVVESTCVTVNARPSGQS